MGQALLRDMGESKGFLLGRIASQIEVVGGLLGDNPWFAGQNLTFIDFHFYELFFQHSKLAPDAIADCKKISAFVKRFEELPKIKAFMESDRYENFPMNNRMAFFGAKSL